MDMDTNDKNSSILPEIDIYLHLNVLIYLMDNNELEKVRTD
jgi:26S proteasome regulatory subunit N3